MSQQPAIPKGTRDFLPDEMIKRNIIFDTLKKIFSNFGYLQIETPAMEKLATLTGKYGDEGDKLIFRILDSGNPFSEIDFLNFNSANTKEIIPKVCEKGLRYDLTVPFARFVVMNRNEIQFPFKRFQIQPVWRADKPQKGRYREFFQCDVDVIGSNSLLNEVELIQIINEAFKKLGVTIVIKINNRKILNAIVEKIGESERFETIMIAVDKIEKIGVQKVVEELMSNGITKVSANELTEILTFKGNSIEKIEFLKNVLENTRSGKEGIDEMEFIINTLNQLNISENIEFDISLARGLSYYTGTIFEVKARDVSIGSICGGGRYDDLTGIFGLFGISGVGVSFGADRIYDVMNQLQLFSTENMTSTKILFLNFGEKEVLYCLELASKLRSNGIKTEVYPDNAKIKKQMSYADSRKIEYVALAGENEINENSITIKNMISGEQTNLPKEQLLDFLFR